MKTYKQKKIKSLLKTNTGSHFLDSGGAYGRHHERNAKRKLNFNEGLKFDDYGVTIPIHVFMDTMFELDDNTKIFNRLLSKEYFWVQEAFEHLENLGFDLDVSGYGGSNADNTYNSDNDLSQDFQYQLFEYDGGYYCLFQLHNGCDIRGGYTNTVVWKLADIDYFYRGWCVDFYDHSNNEEFESYYQIEGDERYELNSEKGCFINKETSEEVYAYSAATGF